MQPSIGKVAFKLINLCAVLFISMQYFAFAFDVTLTWDPKTEADLSGYKLYYGTTSRSYGSPVNSGKNYTYTLTGLNAGTYYFAVTAYYSNGTETGFSNEVSKTFVVDTVPPVLSNVLSSNVTSSSALVSWSTNEASDSQVEFGLTTSYGSATSLNPTWTTSHGVLLSGLVPSTTYNYRIRSRDAVGNLAVSSNLTLTTLADPKIPAPTNVIVK